MRLNRANERRGVILLVVLALLTLFAVVGVAFVLYANSEATAARVAREAETQQRADVDPELALALFLSQLIYDAPDDSTGVGSGLRGHSLARTMYGYNYNTSMTGPVISNNVPYSGIGRLHYPSPLANVDDYNLVNYTWFKADGFLRDPERFGTRTLPADVQKNPYVAGNAPYTYPDLNSFFLAAVKADGTVLTPSFHRKWLFNPNNNFNDMTNPNWTNQVGKYLTVRPRPQEHPAFPAPDDATGDVKNLVGAPGGNDSIWIDIGAPVMTAPDGTKFKMLVAPLIADLDGRINLTAAGNIVAYANTPNTPHASNQGWGSWEVNLAKVLNADQTGANPPTQYINLFTGKSLGPLTIRGKYVPNPSSPPAYTPTTANTSAVAGNIPHFYAQVDLNGLNEAAPGTPSSPLVPPGIAPNNGNSPFPIFPQFQAGYQNGGSENVNHPSLYQVAASQSVLIHTVNPARMFGASDMEPLLRTNGIQYAADAGSSALFSDLFRLCPQHFGLNATNLRYRNLVTTLSMDFARPGVSPYWYSQSGANAYLIQPGNTVPAGNAVQFPTVTPGQPLPIVNNTLTIASPNVNTNSEFDANWRAFSANLPSPPLFPYRINLNRPLPPYPHMGLGTTPSYQAALVPYGIAYDLSGKSLASNQVINQYQAAINARQGLANDIFRRLVAVTGVALPANPSAPLPTDANLIARRWLAQLAVNMVDFIDDDDISTPFNFYNAADGFPVANIGAKQGGDDPGGDTGANPIYWVFGTELPKVVLNEVLAEAQDPSATKAAVDQESVKVWIELFNTMQPTVPANTQTQDTYRVPLYMNVPGGGGYSPYRISIAQTTMNQPPPGAAAILEDNTANVLGKAYIDKVVPFPQSTNDADFANAVSLIDGSGKQAAFTVSGSGNAINAGVDPQSYFLIGPTDPGANYKDPFVAATGTNPGVPPKTPVLRTTNVTYTPKWTGASRTDERTTGLTVMLRRLANPYLPLQPNPAGPYYNPYVTIDYLQYVPIQSNAIKAMNILVQATTRTSSNVRLTQSSLQSSFRRDEAPPVKYASRGKTQPYAACTNTDILVTDVNGKIESIHQAPAGSDASAGSPSVNQEVNSAGTPTGIITPDGVLHSFGMTNYPLPPSQHYDWLVHLDRQLISPMELLHVSGYPPYQLTQRFLLNSDVVSSAILSSPTNLFRHHAPWLDAPPNGQVFKMAAPWWFDGNLLSSTNTPSQSHRLYRLFEFLESGNRANNGGISSINNTSVTTSIAGKVNINTIWDPEIFRALCDANTAIGLPDDTIVDQIFANLLQSRSPNLTNNNIGPVNTATTSVPNGYKLDRPFQPLSCGLSLAGQQYPNGTGIEDTILRSHPNNNTLRLLQNFKDTASVHPYLQTQLLTKIYNNLTTRSNVFAVWVTVGFFEVTDPSTTPPTLGAEIGRSEGRHVRHRMFAIVNRASLFSNPGPPSSTALFDPRSNTNLVPYYSIID